MNNILFINGVVNLHEVLIDEYYFRNELDTDDKNIKADVNDKNSLKNYDLIDPVTLIKEEFHLKDMIKKWILNKANIENKEELNLQIKKMNMSELLIHPVELSSSERKTSSISQLFNIYNINNTCSKYVQTEEKKCELNIKKVKKESKTSKLNNFVENYSKFNSGKFKTADMNKTFQNRKLNLDEKGLPKGWKYLKNSSGSKNSVKNVFNSSIDSCLFLNKGRSFLNSSKYSFYKNINNNNKNNSSNKSVEIV